MKPMMANAAIDTFPVTISASSNNKASARSVSASAIKRVREVRSASKPSGMDSSKNGSDWMEASKPISPGPALSISTARMGTAARLSCSADCASRLDQAKRRKDAERTSDMHWAVNQRICKMRQTRGFHSGRGPRPSMSPRRTHPGPSIQPDQAAQLTSPK